jgi:hypothetical protein
VGTGDPKHRRAPIADDGDEGRVLARTQPGE